MSTDWKLYGAGVCISKDCFYNCMIVLGCRSINFLKLRKISAFVSCHYNMTPRLDLSKSNDRAYSPKVI